MTKLHKAMRIGTAAAVLALGLSAAAAAEGQKGKVQAAQKDPAAETAKAKGLPSAIAKALSRPANVATTQWADGTVAADLAGTYMNVWIAHVNADGTLSHTCVDSVEGAEAALAGQAGLEVK